MPKETLSPRETGMMLLSVLSVIVVLIIAFNDETKEAVRLLLYVDFAICMVFIINFFWGLAKADDRRLYAKMHWIDLVASIPIIEPLRFARVFQVLRVIRLMRMSRSLLKAYSQHKRETTATSLLVALITVLTFASVLILLVEDGVPGANIHDAESAIWWALVTISTVGYGDYYPVSAEGRVIGAMVIICGVSFFGIVAGYLASLFVSPEEQEKMEHQNQLLHQRANALEAKLEAVTEQNRQILARLESLTPPEDPAAGSTPPAAPGRTPPSP